MGVENGMFRSEIGSGFEDTGGTPPPRIPRSTPPGIFFHVIISARRNVERVLGRRQEYTKQTANLTPCYQSLSFACSILAFSRKALHESSKIFFEYALHVARIQSRTQA